MDQQPNKLETFLVPVGYLCLGLIIAGALFYLTPLNHINIIKPMPKKIEASAFYQAFKQNPDEYVLIDIRSIEYRAQEYPEGSIHIPLNTLTGQIDALPRDRTIVIFCESNFSATAAYHVLQNNGFTSLAIINNGREGWNLADLPLNQGSDKQKDTAEQIINLKNELSKVTK